MERQPACGELIKNIHDSLEKISNNTLRSRGLTLSQVKVLLELDYIPLNQMSLKELEKKLHVAQSTAAGLVTRLEQKGLVEGFGDALDHRIKNIRITLKGKKCCKEAEKYMEEAENELLGGMTEEERESFRKLLKHAADNLR